MTAGTVQRQGCKPPEGFMKSMEQQKTQDVVFDDMAELSEHTMNHGESFH